MKLGLPLIALPLLTLGACRFDDWQLSDVELFDFHESVTDGPIEARIELAPGLDPSLVRAGLFRDPTPGEMERSDGEIFDGEAYIDILVSVEGKAKLDVAWSSHERIDVEDLGAARFAPFLPGDLDGDRLTVEFPEPARDDGFMLLVWYDADGDGMLELSRTGDSEFARAPGRSFPDDGQGRLYLTDILAHADEPDGEPYTWKVYADGLNEDGVYVRNHVSDRELDGWTVRIDAPTM